MTTSILIIDDEVKMGKALRLVLMREGYRVDTIDDPRKGITMMEENQYDLLLCDLKMPGMNGLDVLERAKVVKPDVNVIMMTAFASAETAVESMKKGAYDYLIKPFSTDELKILIERCLKAQTLQKENEILREQLQEKFQPANIIVASKIMQKVVNQAQKVAGANVTVLITGESGTGKEMLASVIHNASSRRDRPMVTANCGALTESLLESEMFGHKRGAFTGAVENRMGLFEKADGGTLFLDEIGEVSQGMQVKLLRVLQSGEFQRVGESDTVRVDVRVVAATNRNLEEMVASGEFRTDLYYRLNVVPMFIPPLRERRDDIVALVDHFLVKIEAERRHYFSAEALDVLRHYDWPGNVRELENAVEHSLVLCDGDEMGIDSLPMALRAFAGQDKGDVQSALIDEKITLEEAERRLIGAAMERTRNNMTRAARELGITRRTMGYRLRKYGLLGKASDEEDMDNV